MFKKGKPRCINPKIGKLLADAKSGALDQPSREEDHRLFYEKHFPQCAVCRAALLDHINETETFPLLQEIARKRGIPFEKVLERFEQQAEMVVKKASEQGKTFAEICKEEFGE